LSSFTFFNGELLFCFHFSIVSSVVPHHSW
jgi:hypothetical protein